MWVAALTTWGQATLRRRVWGAMRCGARAAAGARASVAVVGSGRDARSMRTCVKGPSVHSTHSASRVLRAVSRRGRKEFRRRLMTAPRWSSVALRTAGVLLSGLVVAACANQGSTAPTDAGECDPQFFSGIERRVLATEPRPACDDGAWVAWEGDITAPHPVRLVARVEDRFILEVGRPDDPRAESTESLQLAFTQIRGIVPASSRVPCPRCLAERSPAAMQHDPSGLRRPAVSVAHDPSRVAECQSPGVRRHRGASRSALRGCRWRLSSDANAGRRRRFGGMGGEGFGRTALPTTIHPSRVHGRELSTRRRVCGDGLHQSLRPLEPGALRLHLSWLERAALVRLRSESLRLVPIANDAGVCAAGLTAPA